MRLVWASQLLSELGDWAARVALAILVERRTGSAALTGLVTAVSVLPWAGIGWIIASFVDRFPRRSVMVVADLARGLLFGVLILSLPTAAMLVIVFVAACFRPAFESARAAMLPTLVPRDRYGDAIALGQVTAEAMLLTGYVGGGVLAALVSPEVGLLVNAISFFASAGVLFGLRSGQTATAKEAAHRGVRPGLRAVFGERFVRRFGTTYAALAGCAIVSEALAAAYAREELVANYHPTDRSQVAAAFAGILAASVPAGVILATLLLPKPESDTGAMRLSGIVAAVGATGAMATFALDLTMPLAVIPFFFVGAVFASRIPANKVAGLRIPDHVRASAFGILNSLVTTSLAAGAFLGGLLGDRIGVRVACIVFLAIAALVSIRAALVPPRELLEQPSEPQTPTPVG